MRIQADFSDNGMMNNIAINTIRKRGITTTVTGGLVLLLIAFLAGRYGHAQEAALVTTDQVIKQAFTQTVPIIGRLVTKRSGTVATRIDGSVSAVLVQVGDRVTRNQVVARIDTTTLQLRINLAEAQRTEARARLKTASAQLVLAGQEVERLSRLQNSAAISKAAYDDAGQQQNIAFARVREAEAAINSSSASVSLAELDLSYAEIRAPFDGTITDRLTEEGSYLQRGQAVVQLISDQELELEADVPYDRLDGLAAGTRVEMLLDNGSLHQAAVRAIIPEENPRTRTRRVRFTTDLGPEAGSLAVEQSVTVLIPAGTRRDIVTVHKDAVVRRGSDNIVYLVVDDVAVLRSINTGESAGIRIEVLDGLAPGDLTVIRGNERLQPNQKVITTHTE